MFTIFSQEFNNKSYVTIRFFFLEKCDNKLLLIPSNLDWLLKLLFYPLVITSYNLLHWIYCEIILKILYCNMSLTLWFCLHKLTVDYEYFLVLLMLNSYVVSEIVTRGALDMQLGSWFLYSFYLCCEIL